MRNLQAAKEIYVLLCGGSFGDHDMVRFCRVALELVHKCVLLLHGLQSCPPYAMDHPVAIYSHFIVPSY